MTELPEDTCIARIPTPYWEPEQGDEPAYRICMKERRDPKHKPAWQCCGEEQHHHEFQMGERMRPIIKRMCDMFDEEE